MNIYAINCLRAITRCQATIAGMQAENQQRTNLGKSIAYDYDAFAREADYMDQVFEANRAGLET
jgi:hypothetical protein